MGALSKRFTGEKNKRCATPRERPPKTYAQHRDAIVIVGLLVTINEQVLGGCEQA
jgi:hypothetical protein